MATQELSELPEEKLTKPKTSHKKNTAECLTIDLKEGDCKVTILKKSVEVLTLLSDKYEWLQTEEPEEEFVDFVSECRKNDKGKLYATLWNPHPKNKEELQELLNELNYDDMETTFQTLFTEFNHLREHLGIETTKVADKVLQQEILKMNEYNKTARTCIAEFATEAIDFARKLEKQIESDKNIRIENHRLLEENKNLELSLTSKIQFTLEQIKESLKKGNPAENLRQIVIKSAEHEKKKENSPTKAASQNDKGSFTQILKCNLLTNGCTCCHFQPCLVSVFFGIFS